jgi:hypothetical protein
MFVDGVHYQGLLREMELVFQDDLTLPDQVFAFEAKRYAWLEYEELRADTFWNCLASLAAHYGDTEIVACCPCELSEAFRMFGHSGTAILNIATGVNDLQRFLDSTSTDGSIRNTAFILRYWGRSGRWAFAGDLNEELAVGGQTIAREWPSVDEVHFHSFERAMEFAAWAHGDQLADTVRHKYEQNYEALSWDPSEERTAETPKGGRPPDR